MLQQIVYLVIFVDAFSVALILPNVIFRFTALGGTPETYGILSSVYSSSQLFSGIIIGYLADRSIGHKGALLIAYTGASVSYFLVSVTNSLPLLVFSRVLIGLTKHSVTSCTALTSAMSDPSTRTRALARLSSAMTLATLLGNATGGALAHRFDRRTPFMVASLLSALNLAFVQIALPRKPEQLKPAVLATSQTHTVGSNAGDVSELSKQTSAAPSKERRTEFRFKRLALALQGPGGNILILRLVYGLLLRAVYSMHPLYESEVWAVTPEAAGYLSAYSQLLGLAMEWAIVGRLAEKVPERALLQISLMAAAVNSAVEGRHRNFYVYALVHLPAGAVAKSITRSCLSSLFTKSVPIADIGLALSVLNVCQSAVSVVAPLYGGFLLGSIGVQKQPMAAALNYIALSALTLWMLRAHGLRKRAHDISNHKED